MTLQAMQQHEAVTLRYLSLDYRRQGLLRLVKPFVQGARVLDLRCLSGDLSIDLAKRGHQVLALDGFKGAVEMTNRSALNENLPADLASLWELKDLPGQVDRRQFDCVVAIDILNHVENEVETLREIRSVMAENGRLIVLVPACPLLLGKRDTSLGHLRRFTKSGIEARLKKAGFEIEYRRYWSAALFPLYFLLETVLRIKVSDKLRYHAADSKSKVLGPILRFWYNHIEVRFPLPFGLSLFVVARPAAKEKARLGHESILTIT